MTSPKVARLCKVFSSSIYPICFIDELVVCNHEGQRLIAFLRVPVVSLGKMFGSVSVCAHETAVDGCKPLQRHHFSIQKYSGGHIIDNLYKGLCSIHSFNYMGSVAVDFIIQQGLNGAKIFGLFTPIISSGANLTRLNKKYTKHTMVLKLYTDFEVCKCMFIILKFMDNWGQSQNWESSCTKLVIEKTANGLVFGSKSLHWRADLWCQLFAYIVDIYLYKITIVYMYFHVCDSLSLG